MKKPINTLASMHARDVGSACDRLDAMRITGACKAFQNFEREQIDQHFRKLAAALGYTLSDDVARLRAMQTDPGDEQEGAA